MTKKVKEEDNSFFILILNIDLMREMAYMEYVGLEIQEEQPAVVSVLGVLTRNHLEVLAESLIGESFIVAKFSPPDAAYLISTKFKEYRIRCVSEVNEFSLPQNSVVVLSGRRVHHS